jgi:hypothetical protein
MHRFRIQSLEERNNSKKTWGRGIGYGRTRPQLRPPTTRRMSATTLMDFMVYPFWFVIGECYAAVSLRFGPGLRPNAFLTNDTPSPMVVAM